MRETPLTPFSQRSIRTGPAPGYNKCSWHAPSFSLHIGLAFTRLLCPHRLQALFVALNDEAGSVRALAISVVGRLAGLNPGYILPAARKHLIQLLNDMEHSPDSRQRQGTLGFGSPVIISLLAERCMFMDDMRLTLSTLPRRERTFAGPPDQGLPTPSAAICVTDPESPCRKAARHPSAANHCGHRHSPQQSSPCPRCNLICSLVPAAM